MSAAPRERGRPCGCGATAAQDHPRRHGRVLRLGRAARRSGAARQAGRGRRRRAARRGHGGELRGARLRRALGDAGLPGAPALPRADLRAHPLRCLQGGEPPDPRDFPSYTDLVEPLSLDEAYLDVTAPRRGPPSATAIARAIKREILATTGLTASAGVSFNKFLAKVASALDKPDGLTVIRPRGGRRVHRQAADRALLRRRAGHRAQDEGRRHP